MRLSKQQYTALKRQGFPGWKMIDGSPATVHFQPGAFSHHAFLIWARAKDIGPYYPTNRYYVFKRPTDAVLFRMRWL